MSPLLTSRLRLRSSLSEQSVNSRKLLASIGAVCAEKTRGTFAKVNRLIGEPPKDDEVNII